MFHKTRPRLTILGEHTITLDGQNVSYTVKRSPRAKYVRLEMKPESGLTVVVPRSYSLSKLPELVESKSGWILRNLVSYRRAQPYPAGKRLKSGDVVPYLGRSLELVVVQSRGRAGSVRLDHDRLMVSPGSGSGGLNAALERWYRMRAAALIREKAEEVSASLGVSYKRLTIRGQRTRWGSCSPKGNLSFNWKLMMAPEPVIDYVVVHEMAHLKEMNHQKRFWGIVARHCPQWREHKKWLKEHEAGLTA